MDRCFRITRKHYQIILKQGIDNLPIETGGFLGGTDNLIQAILPIYNQHLEDQTGTFGFTPEDMQRAHEFFKKHDLEYFGLYHTHPNGVAYPSEQDISTGHQYHFILSLRNQETPEFAAYEIINRQPHFIPIVVISDKGFSDKDVVPAKKTEIPFPTPILKEKLNKSPEEEAVHLSQMIEDIRDAKSLDYPKMPPKSGEESDFSTLA